MKSNIFFVMSMLVIACLGFLAADCSKCKKSDPNYPTCNPSPPPPPPPPAPAVEKWMLMAAGSYDENHPDWSPIVYYSCSDSLILKLWDNGLWYHRYFDGYKDGISETSYYVHPNGDTSKYIDFYEIWGNGDTTLYEGNEVQYTNRHEANPSFTIPVPLIRTIDSLHLNPSVMRFYITYPYTYMPQYLYYIKMN